MILARFDCLVPHAVRVIRAWNMMSARSEVEPLVDAPDDGPHVRGILHRAARPGDSDGLVLTHGAGSNAHHPLLVALATAFAARGVTVLRCDLPFRQARRTGPPSGRGEIDREGLRRAVGVLRDRLATP